MTENGFTFNKGWLQVKNGDLEQCRRKIMDALKITTRSAFLNRLKGKVEPKITEIKAIEAIFAEYGISEVWGE